MSKRKLLLADDSITIQKVVNLTFADEGIEVISVSDGDAAMIKFNESMPDLVMADVNMPGLDGYRMCEMIKQDEETKHIPVILLVGSFEPFDEQEAFRVGADDFLTKPFQSIRQLVTKVSDLLNPRAEESNSAAETRAAKANNDWQFADTKELPVIETTVQTENLGDTGMDDEMIQTSQVGEPVQFDEVQKFISDSYSYQNDKSENTSDDEDSANDLVKNSFADESADESTGDFSLLEPTAKTENSDHEDSFEATENSAGKIYNLSDYEVAADVEEISAEADQKEIGESEESKAEPQTYEIVDADDASANNPAEPENTSDWQLVTVEDLEEIPVSSESEIEETNVADFEEAEEREIGETENNETEIAQVSVDSANVTSADSEEIAENSTYQTISRVEFDDFDLLELPPLVEETGIRPQPEKREIKSLVAETAPPAEQNTESAEMFDETAAETVAETDATAEEISFQSFPPELIEAIAQKVAERISDKAIREIAWEVVPQMTDLIVKKIVEEQLLKKAKETSE